MLDQHRFVAAVSLIDQANASDPVWETQEGKSCPRTWLYGIRMTDWLVRLYPDAPETAFLAARAQHVCRWLIPRDRYPPGRKGYLAWRTFLYRLHGEKAAQLLRQAGYDESAIGQVKRILMKRSLRRDPQVQMVEDAACLTFLQYYFLPFARDYSDDKLIDILGKTWKKMSPKAQQAAMKLPLSGREARLVQQALKRP
ncbi:hypothetical protein MIN45_P1914 [Methylomarinovum tepidoasis]|uniref:DUF4202 domain-containing protein n=1 Tax=Methylomarinovum tepidoasis TaxID=2840183 RepID=A0AAU9CJG6_9GAMM|nr:DUF4202 domain-containing protein [Methylomarinovum sp. IN45]BCX89541.1 hypothetical protein MIN45_P1914 [Methylomarinovum sp. IN45]